MAAITGSANIVAAVTCRDARRLFAFVTDRVGGLPGIIHVEIPPILSRRKQAGTQVLDGRLERPEPGRGSLTNRNFTQFPLTATRRFTA